MTGRESQFLENLLSESSGLLQKAYAGGRWWALRSTQDPGVLVHYTASTRRPYRVSWRTSCDRRQRNGEWGVQEFYRSRSFKHPHSVVKFIQEF